MSRDEQVKAMDDEATERFWSLTGPDGAGCDVWNGEMRNARRGRWGDLDPQRVAALLTGRLPRGLRVVAMCGKGWCVTPGHLLEVPWDAERPGYRRDGKKADARPVVDVAEVERVVLVTLADLGRASQRGLLSALAERDVRGRPTILATLRDLVDRRVVVTSAGPKRAVMYQCAPVSTCAVIE